MPIIESFNKDALSSSKVNQYFTIVIDDVNNITDIRFLILRFCIACEKVIDDIIAKFESKDKSEIDDVINIQFNKFKLHKQKDKLNLTNLRNFASKISIMKSICDYKSQDDKYLQFLDFLRDVRNIVGHQLITIQDVQSYLIKNKDKSIYTFIKDEAKPLLNKFLLENNFHEILKFLLPLISIELNELQTRIINY